MLPDQMEAEKNRKIIVSQARVIDQLQTNVRELQEQLGRANIRIKELMENKL
mgnify:FL=1|tara:strand:+ start:1681 stop:1836 length:156 start_codon:yes stop_codon:yes gene_type:complete